MREPIRIIILFIFLIQAGKVAHAQQRIITAGSAITETVCALGDCDNIVASDRTSLYPAQIQQLPSIGYRSGINAEGILSLKPTLIIAEKEYVEEGVLQQLKSSNVKLVIIDKRVTFDDVKKAILQIGQALGKDADAKKLVAKNEAELAEAKGWLKRATTSPRALCVYNRGTSTMSIAGDETFGEILKYTGATNAVAGVTGYKPLNTEALIAADPEYLIMLSSGFESLGGMDGVLKVAGVAQTTAGKKKQIVVIDALRLTNFGPRFGETVKELVQQLHPELKAR